MGGPGAGPPPPRETSPARQSRRQTASYCRRPGANECQPESPQKENYKPWGASSPGTGQGSHPREPAPRRPPRTLPGRGDGQAPAWREEHSPLPSFQEEDREQGVPAAPRVSREVSPLLPAENAGRCPRGAGRLPCALCNSQGLPDAPVFPSAPPTACASSVPTHCHRGENWHRLRARPGAAGTVPTAAGLEGPRSEHAQDLLPGPACVCEGGSHLQPQCQTQTPDRRG